ncbi:protein FAM92B-like [Chanos chanos]|uniref:Protein FAM92B-like n=1 Tax=Chanos chanos TaxID=29144 RepID=A0A6J2X0Z9_CHACN|nr:protein FAM92B [Chanos chanos]
MNTMFSRDAQMKAMEMTVNNAETHLGQFCTLFASYTRKTAKLRDKADMLVRQLSDFASTEDPETGTCFRLLSEDFAMVQDYRQAEVERLETKVVVPLKAYGDIVKNKRADLKRLNADRSQALKELQKLERIRLKNPADRQSISQAEVNVQKATSNANRSARQMEETIIDFQRQKLEDLKRIFTDFIMVEMLFHAKALEVYTHTFQNMETMDIDKNLELFRSRVQVSDPLLETQTLPSIQSTSSITRYPSPTPSKLRLTSEITKQSEQTKQARSDLTKHWRLEQADQSVQRGTLRRQPEMEVEEEEEEDDDEMYESEEAEEEPHTIRESYAASYARIHRQK